MWFAAEKTELLKCLRAFFVSVIYTNTTNRIISVFLSKIPLLMPRRVEGFF